MEVIEDTKMAPINREKESITIRIPLKTFNALKKEFDILEQDVESFIVSVIERVIMERASDASSKVFSREEEKELEDDLKGLGYI